MGAVYVPPLVTPRPKPIVQPRKHPVLLDPSAVAHYDFSRGPKLSDYSSKGNHGTITGAVFVANGRHGSALSFDKIDDFVNIGNDSSINDLKPVTVATWVYGKSAGENNQGCILTSRSGSQFRVNDANGGIFYQRKYSLQNIKRVTNNGALSVNAWLHIVATWDGSSSASNIHIYVNGEEKTYQTTTNGVGSYSSDSGTEKRIGNDLSAIKTWDGYIDSLTLYSRVLNANEIKRIYETEK